MCEASFSVAKGREGGWIVVAVTIGVGINVLVLRVGRRSGFGVRGGRDAEEAVRSWEGERGSAFVADAGARVRTACAGVETGSSARNEAVCEVAVRVGGESVALFGI